MSRQINRVTAVLIALFLALIANLTYVQYFEAGKLREQPGNQRILLAEYSKQRGAILLSSAPIAQSVPSNDDLKYLRTYAHGSLYAAVTGYYSSVYGATGLEHQENSVLSGNDSRFFVNRLQQLFANRQPQGGAIRLTINNAAQIAAMKGLAGRTGAVVAIDPKTGAILALASSPSFDPNKLSSHDQASIQKTYTALHCQGQQHTRCQELHTGLTTGHIVHVDLMAKQRSIMHYQFHAILHLLGSAPSLGLRQ